MLKSWFGSVFRKRAHFKAVPLLSTDDPFNKPFAPMLLDNVLIRLNSSTRL